MKIRTVCAVVMLLGALGTSVSANCVNPGGTGGCFSSIQAAVTAAMPSETVMIAAGTYNEVVAVGTAGVVLLGESAKTTIVDAGPPATGDAITVSANSVRIENLTLRNGDADGVVVDPLVTATSIIASQILAMNGTCVNVQGDGTTVDSSTIRGCSGDGVNAGANSLTIVKSRISRIGGDAVVVNGNTSTVTSNRIVGVRGVCVSITGDGNLVERNKIRDCSAEGVLSDGDNNRIERNSVVAAGRDAFSINCDPPLAACAGGSAIGNKATDAPRGNAFDVFATGSTFLVQKNRAARSRDTCYLIDGPDGFSVSSNKATDCGGARGANGYDVSGNGHQLLKNQAVRAHGDGFNVNATNVTLDGNKAIGNLIDGIDVVAGSDLVVLTGNTATGNLAQGVEVSTGATNTTVTGNTGSGNRLDYCDEGTATTATGNMFGTTGPPCNQID